MSACINSLASYSSEEYCEVLSQQAIPLTLYIFVFCFLAANRAHNASKELKEAHCVAVLSTKTSKRKPEGRTSLCFVNNSTVPKLSPYSKLNILLYGCVCFRHAIGQFAVCNLLYGPNFQSSFRSSKSLYLRKKG